MSTKIYNEGRVVGLSAYELYIRHQLSEYPDLPVVSERAWLSATLGGGSSMLLKLSSGQSSIVDIPLPINSQLCAAKTVTASLFTGEASFDAGSVWARTVTSYGDLIQNTSSASPVTPGNTTSTVPALTPAQIANKEREYADLFKEYLKITDGIIIQPGTWSENAAGVPKKDFKPDLSSSGMLRIYINGTLNQDVLVLLSGFMHRSIIAGTSMLDSTSLTGMNPQNGDFLGPEVYPWASKIIFTVPNGSIAALQKYGYVRELEDNTAEKSIDDKPIIDFDSANPTDYYSRGTDSAKKSMSTITLDVTDLNVPSDSGVSVLAAYQRNENYPPVLYGAKVAKEGQQKMAPLDVASPGTVKMFTDADLAKNYHTAYPNTFAMYKDDDSNVFLADDDNAGTMIPLSGNVSVVDHANASGYAMQVTAGTVTRKAVSLQDKDGRDLTLTGSTSTQITQGNTDASHSSWINASAGLSWSHLISALKNNKLIDLLGAALRTFRTNLPNIVSGENGVLTIKGTGESTIAGGLKVGTSITSNTVGTTGYNAKTNDSEFKFDKPVKSGGEYIVVNGLRLYIGSGSISSLETQGVPIGSIAIGYVE